MQEILARGTDAIPTLISQLTDAGHTKEPIVDYWRHTSDGDIAFMVLTDLFEEPDDKTFNMPDVPNWTTIMHGCNYDAESCWRTYIRKHRRQSVQKAWLCAWNRSKNHIYWDRTTQCFRISS